MDSVFLTSYIPMNRMHNYKSDPTFEISAVLHFLVIAFIRILVFPSSSAAVHPNEAEHSRHSN